jgi:hypothetical protein
MTRPDPDHARAAAAIAKLKDDMGIASAVSAVSANLVESGKYEDALTYLLGAMDTYYAVQWVLQGRLISSVRDEIKAATRGPNKA